MSSSFDRSWQHAHTDKIDPRLSASRISADLLARAKFVYRSRRLREREFGDPSLFSDPAWDMMLGLYIDEGQGRSTQVSAACISACVAGTTGLRWLAKLVDLKIIVRSDDPQDRRRSFVYLAPEVRDRISGLLTHE